MVQTSVAGVDLMLDILIFFGVVVLGVGVVMACMVTIALSVTVYDLIYAKLNKLIESEK